MRKTFACGHKGKGAYCHRCSAEQKVRAQEMSKKAAYRQRIDMSGIDLDKLPRQVVEKALAIIDHLQQGKSYSIFVGSKRLQKREVISIPVGRSYRMLCLDEGGRIVPVDVLSHEAYNNRVRQFMSDAV